MPKIVQFQAFLERVEATSVYAIIALDDEGVLYHRHLDGEGNYVWIPVKGPFDAKSE